MRQPEAPTSKIRINASDSGVSFEEVALVSGIDFRWPQMQRPLDIYETVGYGCAFLDYDNDGWQDILLVGVSSPALFRNQRDGKFEDVSEELGLSKIKGRWNGCVVGDYDGDGFLDILLNGYHCLALLKNQSSASFQNVTQKAGLNPQNYNHMGSGGGFMDLDGNGTLDLVLLNYVQFGPQDKQHCEGVPGFLDACPPKEYKPEFPELWKNLGQGRFSNVSKQAGFDKLHGKALALSFTDINDDKHLDLYIGNDGIPSDLMLNEGQLRFRNVGQSSNVAYGMISGRAIAAMGSDWGDFDRDGRLDLIVAAFSDEAAELKRNLGEGIFESASESTELAGITMNPLEFGTKWLDFENDSWPDLVFACGHVFDHAEQLNPLSPWRQPVLFVRNEAGQAKNQRRFSNLNLLLDESLTKPVVGRGLATGDYDNDGRTDILVVDAEGKPLLFHNQTQTSNHWITFDVKGKGANRFAYGTKITARVSNEKWTGQVTPAASYLSSSDPRVHFGLGQNSQLDEVEITGLSGKKTVLRKVRTDQILVVHQ